MKGSSLFVDLGTVPVVLNTHEREFETPDIGATVDIKPEAAVEVSMNQADLVWISHISINSYWRYSVQSLSNSSMNKIS